MKQVKTARGKVLDMAALAKKHEETRAVGNVLMNARGDRLDRKGNVKATVQAISQKQHELAQPKESVPLSNPTPTSKSKKVKETHEPVIMNSTEKTRDDGSKYIEIEYDDGSFETKDIE